MPKFLIPVAMYSLGTLHPARSVVELEIHEAPTGARLCDASGKPVKGVRPLTKDEITAAAEKFRAEQEAAGETVTTAVGKLSVTEAIEAEADAGPVDDGDVDGAEPKSAKPAKKAASSKSIKSTTAA